MTEIADGISITGLTIGGAALTAIGGLLGAVIRARMGRTEITPQPLEVRQTEKYVTCAQCAEHRQSIGNRIDAVAPQLSALSKKLDEIDAKAETRSYNLHRRLDPIVEQTASTRDRLNDHLNEQNRIKGNA